MKNMVFALFVFCQSELWLVSRRSSQAERR